MPFVVIFVLELVLLHFLSKKIAIKIFNKVHNTYLFSVLFFPGTFVHEVSHFLMALVLLVPVGQPEFIPKKIEEDLPAGRQGIKLGSVSIAKCDPFRRTLIGIAPLIVGVGIILGSTYYVYVHNLFKTPFVFLFACLIFEIGNTMFSSKKDMEGSIVTFVIIILMLLGLYFVGVRVNLNINYEIFKLANLFLILPIAMDLLLL